MRLLRCDDLRSLEHRCARGSGELPSPAAVAAGDFRKAGAYAGGWVVAAGGWRSARRARKRLHARRVLADAALFENGWTPPSFVFGSIRS